MVLVPYDRKKNQCLCRTRNERYGRTASLVGKTEWTLWEKEGGGRGGEGRERRKKEKKTRNTADEFSREQITHTPGPIDSTKTTHNHSQTRTPPSVIGIDADLRNDRLTSHAETKGGLSKPVTKLRICIT